MWLRKSFSLTVLGWVFADIFFLLDNLERMTIHSGEFILSFPPPLSPCFSLSVWQCLNYLQVLE